MAIDKEIRQSLRFKMRRGRFCSVMFSVLWVKPVIVLLCLMGVSTVLASLYDIRYFIVSLMIAFIVCPMALAYMYYHYGLGKYCYFNVTDHALRIDDGGVTIDMYFPIVDDDEEQKESDEEEDPESEREEKHLELFIEYNKLRVYYVGSKCVFFPIVDKKICGFLWIPESAYPSDKVFIRAVDKISERVSQL